MLCGIVPSLELQAWVNVLQLLSEGGGPEQRCIAGAGVCFVGIRELRQCWLCVSDTSAVCRMVLHRSLRLCLHRWYCLLPRQYTLSGSAVMATPSVHVRYDGVCCARKGSAWGTTVSDTLVRRAWRFDGLLQLVVAR